MKETIYNLLAQQGDMTWQQITMHILVSAVIGLFIFISYVTHIRERFTAKNLE